MTDPTLSEIMEPLPAHLPERGEPRRMEWILNAAKGTWLGVPSDVVEDMATEIERQASEIERLTNLALRGQTREDKILRLEAEIERLREALQRCHANAGGTTGSTVRRIARAALDEKEPDAD